MSPETQICGTVRGDEIPDGPMTVEAYAERVASGAPAAAVEVGAPGPFALGVPAGTWWLRASAAGGVGARAAEAVTVAAGARVEGVVIDVEVPDLVR
jgi:hypothetical protein